MSKIVLREPHGPYRCELDTDVMIVEVRECFNGLVLISESGEKLGVCMRDSGFDIHYFNDDDFDRGWISFNEGIIMPTKRSD